MARALRSRLKEPLVPLTPASLPPALEIVCDGAPGRLNEDAWLVMQSGHLGERVLIAAIDGATTRLTPPLLQRYLNTLSQKLTPAAYAARVVRDALTRLIAEGMITDLRALLLEANADLGRALIERFGELSLERMGFPDEIYDTLSHDPRLVRLALPACVVTLAEYDPATNDLRWAHAGDTALIVAYDDGRVEFPTAAHAPEFDNALTRAALKLRGEHPDMPFRALAEQPEVRKLNLNNGLRHNYVDKHGLPQPGQGVGVLDGLPELRYFVQTGTLSLDRVRFAGVLTDGLLWPTSTDEVFAPDTETATALAEERRAFMAEQIRERGLAGYLALLRYAEREDADHETYPRLKTHDDATGVLLRFDTPQPVAPPDEETEDSED